MKAYKKGYKFENEIVKLARKDGHLAFRTAGSHSPVDVVIVDEKFKIIYLIQAKHTKCSQKRLKEEFERSEKGFKIIWKVMEKNTT